MNKKYKNTKRAFKNKSKKLWEKIVFLFKASLFLVVLFFIVLFLLTKPLTSINNLFSSHSTVLKADSTREEIFIEKLAPYALDAQALYGVRPSVLIAQAALESSWGDSDLSKEVNNYFGIKGSSEDEEYLTSEYMDEEWIKTYASFRRYETIEESVMDYAQLLVYGLSWNPNLYTEAVTATNYKDAALAIQNAGYATDPNYADKIIQIIEQYQLFIFDN